MEITILGAITAVVSIYAFFRNEKLLLYMLVFLSTFTAAQLFNITITTTPIVVFEFTGGMWILREIVNFIKKKEKINVKTIINKFKENKLATAFLIFIIAIILSEVYLAVSGLNIDYTDIDGNAAVVKFSKTNITQAVLVIFIFIVMIGLSFKIKTKEEVRELLKVFCVSSIFAVIWGLLQFITYYLGVPYPAFLFNNNEYAAQCYDQIDNNIKRISSIALEPSMFATNLMSFIPFIMGAYLESKGKLSDKKHRILFILVILATICAILTTSSTTYVGLVAVYAMYVIYTLFGFIKNGPFDNRWKNFLKIGILTVISIAIAACMCIVFTKIGYKLGTIEYIQKEQVVEGQEEEEPKYNDSVDNMLTTLKQMTIGKLMSGSGQERINGENIGMSMFKNSPIFGLGFGSYRTFSLFTNLLLNTGIIRNTFFLLYIICCAKSTNKI